MPKTEFDSPLDDERLRDLLHGAEQATGFLYEARRRGVPAEDYPDLALKLLRARAAIEAVMTELGTRKKER